MINRVVRLFTEKISDQELWYILLVDAYPDMQFILWIGAILRVEDFLFVLYNNKNLYFKTLGFICRGRNTSKSIITCGEKF